MCLRRLVTKSGVLLCIQIAGEVGVFLHYWIMSSWYRFRQGVLIRLDGFYSIRDHPFSVPSSSILGNITYLANEATRRIRAAPHSSPASSTRSTFISLCRAAQQSREVVHKRHTQPRERALLSAGQQAASCRWSSSPRLAGTSWSVPGTSSQECTPRLLDLIASRLLGSRCAPATRDKSVLASAWSFRARRPWTSSSRLRGPARTLHSPTTTRLLPLSCRQPVRVVHVRGSRSRGGHLRGACGPQCRQVSHVSGRALRRRDEDGLVSEKSVVVVGRRLPVAYGLCAGVTPPCHHARLAARLDHRISTLWSRCRLARHIRCV